MNHRRLASLIASAVADRQLGSSFHSSTLFNLYSSELTIFLSFHQSISFRTQHRPVSTPLTCGSAPSRGSLFFSPCVSSHQRALQIPRSPTLEHLCLMECRRRALLRGVSKSRMCKFRYGYCLFKFSDCWVRLD